MEFASIRIVTADVDRLAAFYGRLTGRDVLRPHPLFAQVPGRTGVIAIASDQTVPAMAPADLHAASNSSVIIEFQVDNVDQSLQALALGQGDVIMEPRTMPWGNRSVLIRDPDGNVVNVYSMPPSTTFE